MNPGSLNKEKRKVGSCGPYGIRQSQPTHGVEELIPGLTNPALFVPPV